MPTHLGFFLPFHQIWFHRLPGQIDREAAAGGVPSVVVERQNHSEGRRAGDGARQVNRGSGGRRLRVEGNPGEDKGWDFRFEIF